MTTSIEKINIILKEVLDETNHSDSKFSLVLPWDFRIQRVSI